MIRRVDLRGLSLSPSAYRAQVPRAPFDVEAAIDTVRPILDDVRHRGETALLEYARQFDGVELESLRVPKDAITRALDELDPDVRAGFAESIRRLRRVSEHEREPDTTVEVVPGGRVSQRLVPFDRVGVYAPGGVTPLPSSAIMTLVPAQVAGVGQIAFASPPQPEFGGLPHPTILAVCALLGIDEVYATGGACAMAMFAYGAGECAPVDFVAGPGRITTVAAKRLLKGVVGIDSEAGPTEIAILADDTADPAFVAADLISQAEHDTTSASLLVTPSEPLAAAVERELAVQVPAAKHAERIAAALDSQQSGIVLVDDLDHGLDVVNAYAAEHVEVITTDARERAGRIRNAGAIFVGPWSPVSLGDYCAGSNHVLPTAACACHSSGLSVRSFTKAVHVVDYDATALAGVTGHVVTLATTEDLPAHGEALRIRTQPTEEMSADPNADDLELRDLALASAQVGAHAILRVLRGGPVDIDTKSHKNDFVTTADHAAEAAVLALIRAARPDDAVLAEESGEYPGTTGVRWLIDPLDGTMNFVHHRRDYAVSVGVERDGATVAGAIVRPYDGDWAAAGGTEGIGRNEVPRVSATKTLEESLVGIGLPSPMDQRQRAQAFLGELQLRIRDYRRGGSSACEMLSVAFGEQEGYIGFGVNAWDVSAGIAIVQAAGGRCTWFTSASGIGGVVAGTPAVAQELLTLAERV